MRIEAGYDIAFNCLQKVPMMLMLSVHPSRRHDLLTADRIKFSPKIAWRCYLDVFGNICTRLVAPPGLLKIHNRIIIADSGMPDRYEPEAQQCDIDLLPDETIVYLLGSHYCDTQKMSDLAWSLFGHVKGGWRRVQAICDYVHERLEFGYHHARCDRTAAEAHAGRIGVCRDFAHLAVTLCRCMNIPDARHNHPRIGRILLARGRDAADVAISTTFGPVQLAQFSVVTEELCGGREDASEAGLIPTQPTPSTREFA